MKETFTFTYDGQTYICYNYAKENEINNKLDSLRKQLGSMKFTVGMAPVNVDIYICYSREINAYSYRLDDDMFAIILPSVIFDGFNDELEGYLINNDLRQYFFGRKKTSKWHAEKIVDYICTFIALHEYYHILNGHLKSSKHKKALVDEKYSINCNNNLYNHITELDADYCATRSCLYFINRNEDYIVSVKMLAFALYFLFINFQVNCYEGMNTLKHMKNMTHPPAGIRETHVMCRIMYDLMNTLENNKHIDVYKDICELCMYFDRVYYDSYTIDLALFTIAYTKKGSQYLETLHNGWTDIRKELEPYAYIKLKTLEKINIQDDYWINSNGEMMYDKILSNLLNCRYD